MNVILVNESRGKAGIRARRVLSRFLPQLGRRVWAGRISQEGLDTLHGELRAGASKFTAVSCLRVATRQRLEPVFIVGSAASFDENGRFAFRRSRLPRATSDDAPPLLQLLQLLGRLAALFHDLGKVSVSFQRKLFDGVRGEPLRHELLSMLMVLQVLHPLTKSKSATASDLAWLEQLATNPAMIGIASAGEDLLTPSTLKLAQALQRGQSNEVSVGAVLGLAQTPLLGGLLWLVLTHHRQIGTQRQARGESKNNDPSFVAEHVNQGTEAAALVNNVRLAPGEAPWQETQWLARTRRAAAALLALLRAHPTVASELLTATGKPNNDWALLLSHHAHPLLVYADRAGSIRKRTPALPLAKADTGTQLYANTREGGLSGDTLSTHLISVGVWSDRFYRLLREQDFLFPRTRFSADSPVNQPSGVARFAWQEQATGAVHAALTHRAGPAFVAVISDTGSGKTLGAAKLIQALSPTRGVRYTVALGRRSLTQEAGIVLRQEAGLSASDCATIIGNATATRLAEQDSPQAARGSESLMTSDCAGVEGEGAFGLWVDRLGRDAATDIVGGPRTLRLIDVPVLCCTVDHLVSAVQWTRSSDTGAALRLYTADLVLDEIDDYAAGDLVALGKLVFETARNGHSVIVMSATAPALVIEALQRAWVSGHALYARLQGLDKPPGHVFIASNLEPLLAAALDAKTFRAEYRAYVTRFCAHLKTGAVRRRVSILPLPRSEDRQVVYEAIVQGAQLAHQRNHVVDPVTGIRVSIGAVRLRTAASAFELGIHCFNRDDENDAVAMRFNVYHAKMPLLARHVLESEFRALLNRKDPPALWRNPRLRALLDAHPTGDLAIIILATSIIETGRDFDLDWGLYEANSLRALIQFAGRIRRHRPEAYAEPNLFVFDQPLRVALSAPGPTWGYPGVEGAGSVFSVNECIASPRQREVLRAAGIGGLVKSKSESLKYTHQVLPLTQWQTGIDSQAALIAPVSYEDSRLGALELAEVALNLEPAVDGAGQPLNGTNLAAYFQSPGGLPASLFDYHARENVFRRSTSSQIEVHLNPHDDPALMHVFYCDVREMEYEAPRFEPAGVLHTDRAFLPLAPLMVDTYAKVSAQGRFGVTPYRLLFGAALSTFEDEVSVDHVRGQYHPLLGFRVLTAAWAADVPQ